MLLIFLILIFDKGEMKMVEFWGFLGALVLRAEREERECLSERGGVLQVMRLARELGTFS